MTDADNYMQYRAGWIDGAKGSAMDPNRSEHPDKAFSRIYDDGYSAGRHARMEMGRYASTRFNYLPSPLRLWRDKQKAIP